MKNEPSHIILASQSPRRKELLSSIISSFSIVPSTYIEHIDQSVSPQEIVINLANGKAMNVWKDNQNHTIIGSDTIVSFENKKLGKPISEEELYSNLKRFSGNSVDVWTGMCIIKDSILYSKASHGEVRFDTLTEKQILEYITHQKADWCDKAGGFAVQGAAQSFTHVSQEEWNIIVGLDTQFVSDILCI